MPEIRKLAAILVTDVVGFSRLAGADEEGTLALLRTLRGEVVDPAAPPTANASSRAPATARWLNSAAWWTLSAAPSTSRPR